MRTAIDLNFNWKYADHFSEDMLRPSYDEADMCEVQIPHTNKELPYNYFDEKDVVRHEIVGAIIKAYERFDRKQEENRMEESGKQHDH